MNYKGDCRAAPGFSRVCYKKNGQENILLCGKVIVFVQAFDENDPL